MTTVSTYATWYNQRTINSALQNQVNTLNQEASSGVYSNPAVQLGSQSTVLYHLQNEYSQQTAIQTAATAAGNKLTTMQTALTAMNTAIGTISTQALGTSSADATGTTEYGVTATEATSTMNQLLTQLNTTYNGQYLFSGQDSGTATMVSSSSATNGPNAAISTALSNAVAANGGAPLTSSDLTNLTNSLNSMFSDTSGSATTNYTGAFYTASSSSNPVSVSVGGGQTVSYNLTGSSQAFRDVFKGLSMLSMLNAPSSQLDDSAKQQLALQATTLLNQGQSELTTQTAQVGAVQAQLSNISDTQQTAATATQLQISSMSEVDETSIATQLSAAKNQLEASYTITSQISSLSFLNYMK